MKSVIITQVSWKKADTMEVIMSKAKTIVTGIIIIALLFIFVPFTAASVCGDFDGDEAISIFDITGLIGFLYLEGPPPADPAMVDVNSSGDLNIFDISYLVAYLYLDGPAPACQGNIHEELQTGCLAYEPTRDDTDYVYFEVLGNDLHIRHINAYYNCGLAYVVDYTIGDFNVYAIESDTGEPADCYCYFNLESVLYDLADGEYTVTLIGIAGDTLKTGTVVVDADFGLIGYEDTGCLEKSFGDSTSTIVYVYSGDTLNMLHYNAFFNCTAVFYIPFEQAGDTLRFYELNVSQIYVYCLCYFNIFAYTVGISPGDYIAEVYEQQYDWDVIQLVDRQEIHLE
jgi:hypothetical protein